MVEFEEQEQEQEQEEDNDGIKENEITNRVNLAVEYVRDAMCLVVILFSIIPKYPMLQRISITDSKNKRVKLCLGGEKFVGCRNAFNICSMISSKRAEGWTMNKKGGGYVPVLRLPNSGYVMKGVTTAYMEGYSGKSERLLKATGSDSEAETLTLDAFAEEEGVFSEAMVQIQAKRLDVIEAHF